MRDDKCFGSFVLVFIISGLLVAMVIFGCARQKNDSELSGDSYTKRDLFELDKIGGKSYILFTNLNDWFASLWRGRRLAYTVGVLSVAGFLGCRHLAKSLERARTSNDPNSPR
jgi:hypothetical protein